MLYCKLRHLASFALLLAAGDIGLAQDTFLVRPAEPLTLPLVIDSNTPTFWSDSTLRLFSSAGTPRVTAVGESLDTQDVQIDSSAHLPMWIESVWQAEGGVLYAWYHHERAALCPGAALSVPEIGALVSYDAGKSFTDLGIVLTSGEPDDCSAQNGYFANGHGDFSVIPDRDGQYFYFLFGAYGGDVSAQGVAIARMSIENLPAPVGAVWKYYAGQWSEPGLGGRLTPVFPATVAWQAADTDAFWGPSVHWNTYLQQYVVLMNRSCCSPEWPQEGIYLTMTRDIGDPSLWSAPVKVLDAGDWYPWVLGTGPGETSSEAGNPVRLFVRNASEWELVFRRADEQPPVEEVPVAPQ